MTMNKSWIVDEIDTPVGVVPKVSTIINTEDRLGAIKVRLGLKRMNYVVNPGIYAVGSPTDESPVFISANYKLSFDHLRKALNGIDGWIVVIDTKGINVWCVAGKGTFGTDEIINRIEVTQLAKLVKHRRIIVPQLGAPGVAAHKVEQYTNFHVVYGPVRAKDIPEFLDAGMKTTPEMRQVFFNLSDRLVLVPNELTYWGRYAFLIAIGFFILTGISRNGYNFPGLAGGREALIFFGAFFFGGSLAPALLPWLPGRAFSVKGMTVGLFLVLILIMSRAIPVDQVAGELGTLAWVLLLPAITAFMAMNFTGASTYTSLSGVRKEMKFAVPLLIVAASIGFILWMIARFL